MDILIAGGGVAGIEALLALRAMAGDRVRLTLAAPDPQFTYRPLAVAEPFARGHAYEVPLTRFAEDAGAELVIDAVAAVDDRGGQVRLEGGDTRAFDALLLATGAHPVPAVPQATTWMPGGDQELYGGLLRDLEEGYTKSVAVVVPDGPVWPLPAYELALMTAGDAREMGQDDVRVTLVTPESRPLAVFGDDASDAVVEELRAGGVELRTGVVREVRGGEVVLDGDDARIPAQRVYAIPRLVGPGLEGVPADDAGFIVTAGDGRVEGAERTWAVGDGIASPVKFGGLATHQARRAAVAIARLAGAEDLEDPGEAVLHGRLLLGHGTRRLSGRPGADAAPLWWPGGKIAGEHLPRWLVEHGVVPAGDEPETPEEGIEITRAVRDIPPDWV